MVVEAAKSVDRPVVDVVFGAQRKVRRFVKHDPGKDLVRQSESLLLHSDNVAVAADYRRLTKREEQFHAGPQTVPVKRPEHIMGSGL